MHPDRLLLGGRWDSYRSLRQFGFEEIGGALSEIPTEEVAQSSLADVIRSGAEAYDVPWGAGAQDYVLEQSIPGSEPVATGTFDAGSLSDRLRDIAAGVAAGATREEAITGTPGGQAYDPSIRMGTLDWSSIIRNTPGAVNAVAQVVNTVARTVGTLAGVRAGAPPGNPAPGGSPSPGLLQRFLSGAHAGTVTAPAGGRLGGFDTGSLLLLGLAGGLGYLFLRKRA